ncbi:MAG: GIY-YIG nuclease family protein [Halohasta sp.]
MSDQSDRVDAARDDTSGHYVYVLRCADDTLYTGYTTDPERRLREHNAGEGAKYTRGRTPLELVHLESYDTQSAAMSREYEIKQLRRAEKERLVETGTPTPSDS